MSEHQTITKSFGSDNHSGIHPVLLKKLIATNHGHAPSYGTDNISSQVKALLKQEFGETVEPYFVFNGTAANVLALKSLVASYNSVICTDISHLNSDECGAPEQQIGCKLIAVPSQNGKLTPQQIDEQMTRLGDQHYSQPKAVSITQPTEVGTVYSVEELTAIRETATKHKLYLHIDGARLIYAAHYLNVSLKALTADIGVDAVSFGGTKNGLLMGEAVLLYHLQAFENFKYIRKQSMQLPSKMRFIASQFAGLLEHGDSSQPLWSEIARHGHAMALKLAQQLSNFPEIKITQPVQANSVFACIPKAWAKELRKRYFFYIWDDKTWEARLMMSFDSSEQDIENFIELIKEIKSHV